MNIELKEIAEVCSLVKGVVFSKSDATNVKYNGGIPIIRAGNIQEELLLEDDLVYVPSRKVKKNQFIRKEDIIMCTSSGSIRIVGKCAISGKDWEGSFGAFNICLRPKEKVESKFIFYYLRSPRFKNWTLLSAGANIKNIRSSELAKFKIPLPSLETQKKIAEILDQADALRKKTQQIIDSYDELAQSIFVDMFGDPVMNPKGWELKTLKNISTKILSGNTPKGGKKVYVEKGIVFFRSQNVWRNRMELDDVAYIDFDTHNRMRNSWLKNGDILMTKTGRFNTENSSLGRAAMFLGEDDSANINGHVYLIRLQKNIVKEFVLFILTTKSYRDYIRRVCVGGIDKRQINKIHLEEFPIITPQVELQKQFAASINLINQQKELANQSLKQSEDLFNTLLQKAFKGEIVNSV